MKSQRLVLSVRTRIQYKAFLMFYYRHSISLCADGSRNPDYIADPLLRFATALFESRDELFDRTLKEHPDLIEQYERQYSHFHTGGGYKNRQSFITYQGRF